MRRWKQVVLTAAGLLLPVTPLWAHQDRTIHFHATESLPLLALAAVLAVFLVRRRSRAHPTREG